MVDPEEFHRFAVAHHLDRLVNLCTTASPGVAGAEVRLSAADALAWSLRLHDDVPGDKPTLPCEFLDGCRWARHRVVHGDVTILGLHASGELDGRWASPDIWHLSGPPDPEATWSGEIAHGVTARFAEVGASVSGDRHGEWRTSYNRWVAGRRVVTVCHLLRGGWTMGSPFDGL